MKKYNIVGVFDFKNKKVLMCKKTRNIFVGKYNFPGGKVEKNESNIDAAYRELYEETGISKEKVDLVHMLDYMLYNENIELQFYISELCEEVELVEEINPLKWFDLNDDFTDVNKFAGYGNIQYMINISKKYYNYIDL